MHMCLAERGGQHRSNPHRGLVDMCFSQSTYPQVVFHLSSKLPYSMQYTLLPAPEFLGAVNPPEAKPCPKARLAGSVQSAFRGAATLKFPVWVCGCLGCALQVLYCIRVSFGRTVQYLSLQQADRPEGFRSPDKIFGEEDHVRGMGSNLLGYCSDVGEID